MHINTFLLKVFLHWFVKLRQKTTPKWRSNFHKTFRITYILRHGIMTVFNCYLNRLSACSAGYLTRIVSQPNLRIKDTDRSSNWCTSAVHQYGSRKTTYTYGLLTKCEVKMAGYWPSSFFACLWIETKSRSVNSQKKNEANIQPSWPNKLGQ